MKRARVKFVLQSGFFPFGGEKHLQIWVFHLFRQETKYTSCFSVLTVLFLLAGEKYLRFWLSHLLRQKTTTYSCFPVLTDLKKLLQVMHWMRPSGKRNKCWSIRGFEEFEFSWWPCPPDPATAIWQLFLEKVSCLFTFFILPRFDEIFEILMLVLKSILPWFNEIFQIL